MPNWCSTTIAIYGNTDDLYRLKSKLDELSNGIESRVKNGFGNLWEGNLLDIHGVDWESVVCRGVIDDYGIMYNREDEKYLYLQQTDAWSPNTDYLEAIINKGNYDLEYVYCAEEPGCAIYLNSDAEQRFLQDRYKIDFVANSDIPEMNISEGEDCCEYFIDEVLAVEWFTNEFVPVESWPQIVSLFTQNSEHFDLKEVVEFKIPD